MQYAIQHARNKKQEQYSWADKSWGGGKRKSEQKVGKNGGSRWQIRVCRDCSSSPHVAKIGVAQLGRMHPPRTTLVRHHTKFPPFSVSAPTTPLQFVAAVRRSSTPAIRSFHNPLLIHLDDAGVRIGALAHGVGLAAEPAIRANSLL
jgi:hypothetical protein